MQGNLRLTPASLIFYALTVLMTLMTVVSAVSAVGWINRSFPGFLVYPFPNVGSFGRPDWPGYAAGIKYMDRIVSVDGQAVHSGRQILDYVKDKSPGTPVRYGISSKGISREVILPVHAFSLKDFLIVFVVAYVFGVALYVLGIVVFVLKPNIHSSWVFLVMCFAMGTYVGTGFEIQSSYHFVYIHYLIIPLVAGSLFHLFSIFPDKKRILKRHPALEYAIYIPTALIAGAYLLFLLTHQAGISANWIPHPQIITPVNRIFYLVCALFLVVFLMHAVIRAGDPTSRARARMILFGICIAFIPTVLVHGVVMFFKVAIPWNLMVFISFFFPASIAYSIVRHNLFDADEIIKRTVGYFVVTAVVIGAYVLSTVLFNVFMEQYQVAQSQAFPILFTVGVILVFNPLRNRTQTVVNRLFFRQEYDYGAIVDKIGNAVTSMLDLNAVLNRLVQTFTDELFINTSSIMLLAPSGNDYQVSLAGGAQREAVVGVRFNRDEPLMEIVENEQRELTKYDLLEDPKYKLVCEDCERNFDALHASLMVPLVYQGHVIGSINLGEKKSGKAYNRKDIDLLRTIANQGAMAIENARLFQENLEKQRMEEELNIARDLQMSMLPTRCPQIEGFQIAASSTPAREVGGDFYDFSETPDGNIAFLIGDVTGKSVSGALVMAASRSIFRMLSEEAVGIRDIMIRANRRAKKDIRPGMFVALLYAVLDISEGRVTFCSAGQTQPILFSAETGKAVLVETKGDTFPLGILDEADYQETRLKLSPGDRVIFYTDGIVEAMNSRNEMFGFDRLLAVVGNAGSMPANALHEHILRSVTEFSGDAPQHDDLTIIVLSM